MTENRLSFTGFYPFDNNSDYEQQIVENCSVISFDELVTAVPKLVAAGNFNVMHLNCYSLRSKYDCLQVHLSQFQTLPDILCLTESWTDARDIYYPLEHYNMYNFPRSLSKRGGIVIYIKDVYHVNHLKLDVAVSTFEFACLSLSVNNSDLTLLCIYRPPQTSKDVFCCELENLVSVLSAQPNSVITCGDFNIDAFKDSKHFNSLVTSHLLINSYPVIFYPTRVTKASATLLDHMYCNFEHVAASGVVTDVISDHRLTYVSVGLPSSVDNNCNEICHKTFRPINKRSLDCLRRSLRAQDWSFISDTSDVNQDYDELVSILTVKLDTFLPVKRIPISNDKKPWITHGIKASCKHKSKLFKLMCQGKVSKEQYNTYRNKLTSIIRLSKIKYYSSVFDNNPKNSKIAWKVINEITGKNANKNESLPNNLNCNDINRFFATLGSNAISNVPPDINDYETVFPHISSTFVFDNATAHEVELTARSLPCTNSSGHDGFSGKLVTNIIDCISLPVSKIFNKSVHLGIVPQSLKIARVVPIFKSGDKTKLINYRPISIIPTFSKLFEKLMYNRMIKFIDKYNILSSSQYGFRSGRSTNHAILDLVNSVTMHLDAGDKAAGLFIDISKAFDSLNHRILLKKLSAYGFRGLIYNWFSSYLNNRLQFVDINGNKSLLASLHLGIPQGSVLGPLLFLLYINDLPLISQLCKFILFADDTTILFHEKSYAKLSSLVNSTLQLLHNWFVCNKLSLNLMKTCVLPFNTRSFVELDDICLNDVLIKCVCCTKFLGVHIDFNLSWTEHVNFVCGKLSQCAAMLKACAYLLPLYIRIKIYFAYAYPYLIYASECWGGTHATLVSSIVVLQKRIIRLLFGLFYRSHCAPFAALAGILYFPDLVKLLLLKLAYQKFHNLGLPDTVHNMFCKSDHRFSTRNRNLNFFVTQSRLKIRHDGPILSCIRAWNSLSSETKLMHSLNAFKHCVLQKMFSHYT